MGSKIRVPLPVKIAASVLLLALVLTKVDAQALLRYLVEGNPYFVILATVAAVVAFLTNTYKWQVLISEPGAHISYVELLRLNFIGLFYNLVLPGQVGGEVIKSVSLARMRVSAAVSAVSVVADRVTGLLALFLLGIVGAVLMPAVTTVRSELLPWLVGLMCVFTAATVVLVTGRGQEAILAVGKVVRVGPAPRMLDALSEQLSAPVRGWSSLWVPLFISGVVQAVIVYANLLICFAFGIPVTYVQLLWIVAVVSLLQSLPISIAGIGVREGAYVYLLQQQGVEASSALALSLTVFAIQVLLAGAGGLMQLYSVARKR